MTETDETQRMALDRVKSAIYARVSGELASLLDSAKEHGTEWLVLALEETRQRYAQEMDSHYGRYREALAASRPAAPAEVVLPSSGYIDVPLPLTLSDSTPKG